MNILQLVSSSRTSGAEKHVAVLCDRLHQRGHNVVAVCPEGEWLPEQLRQAGIPTIQMEMRGLKAFATPVNLAKYMRENRIDILHSHLTRATYYGLVAGRMASRPLISSVHCRTHDVAYRFLFPQRRSQIVSVSDFIRNGLLRKGVSEDRIRTIYNGTEFLPDDLDSCELPFMSPPEGQIPLRAELSLPADAELIGLIGRVDEFKGHLVLARAVSKIVASRPKAYFILVGPVNPEIQKSIWEITSAEGVADRLRFTGVRNDIQWLISEMQLLTLPSRYEACSMSIIESMAMGKPVVATHAGGNPELIEHGVTGMLIERNPDSLAEAITTLLNDPIKLKNMGQAARDRAIERFSARVMVDNIENLYREILAQPIHQAVK
jgi:glycosyltransferase involved in cell wall biosynthesis